MTAIAPLKIFVPCPECDGAEQEAERIDSDDEYWTACHLCNGAGEIEVDEQPVREHRRIDCGPFEPGEMVRMRDETDEDGLPL